MTPQEHRSLRELLGAFVLGQLTPAERSVVADHVSGCDTCRTDVDELAPTARLLPGSRATWHARATAAGAGATAAPRHDLVAEMLTETRRRPHPRRRAGAGAAVRVLAVAAAMAAGFVGGSQLGPSSRTGAPVAATGTAAAPPVDDLDVRTAAAGVAGTAGLVAHTWGTEIKLDVTGLAEGATYQVSIVTDDGTVVAARSFLGTGEAAARCSLNAALPRDAATTVRVSDGAGVVVLAAG